jgi:hypothetical protein
MILHRFFYRRLQTEETIVKGGRNLAVERDHLSPGLAARPATIASRFGRLR